MNYTISKEDCLEYYNNSGCKTVDEFEVLLETLIDILERTGIDLSISEIYDLLHGIQEIK